MQNESLNVVDLILGLSAGVTKTRKSECIVDGIFLKTQVPIYIPVSVSLVDDDCSIFCFDFVANQATIDDNGYNQDTF